MRTHTRDPLGRRTGLAVDLVTGFDSSDWSVDTTTAEHANAYTFDHLGQLTRVTQSGGVSGNAGVAAKRVDLEYDVAGRITKVKRRDGLLDTNTIVAETTNTYGTSFLSASSGTSTATGRKRGIRFLPRISSRATVPSTTSTTLKETCCARNSSTAPSLLARTSGTIASG